MATGGETKKRASIVASLTLWYVTLTIVNIGVFWVGAGSNQMRLISEKATVSARSVAFEVLRRIQPFIDANAALKTTTPDFRTAAPRFQALLQNGKPRDILTNYRVITSGAELLYAWPETKGKEAELSAKEILDSLKALQLKELKNEMFIGVPDLVKREINLFIPMTSGNTTDLILASKVPLPEIQREITGLIRLGIGMVVLLLALQTGMGVLIYRSFVVPIKNVSAAALRMSTGAFEQVDNTRKKDDEINQLMNSFNTMSSELKKNRDVMQLELNIARKIQASILPQTLRAGRLLAHIHYKPLATVSGDYYDFLELSDGSIAIFIGDASGHGVPAAFITVMAKVYFTSLVEKIETPSQLLSVMNERMASYFSGAGLYLTAFYLRIYPDGRAIYCNALHPDPILLRENGSTELLKPTGFYVGLMKKVFREYKDEQIKISAGDRIVLYTDGLTEALNPESVEFTAERFIQLTENNRSKSPADIIQKALHEVATHQAGEQAHDDETLIIIEMGELEQAQLAPAAPPAPLAAALPQPEIPALPAITEEAKTQPAEKPAAPQKAAAPAPVVPKAEKPPEKNTYEFEKSDKYLLSYEKMRTLAKGKTATRQLMRSAENAIKDRSFWDALAGFMVIREKNGGDAHTLFHIALALYGLKRYPDCIGFIDSALTLDGHLADAYWLRALCAIKTGERGVALSSIRLAISEKPEEVRYQKVLVSLKEKKL